MQRVSSRLPLHFLFILATDSPISFVEIKEMNLPFSEMQEEKVSCPLPDFGPLCEAPLVKPLSRPVCEGCKARLRAILRGLLGQGGGSENEGYPRPLKSRVILDVYARLTPSSGSPPHSAGNFGHV